MNVAIAKILKSKIETLPWTDLVSGLVREYVRVDSIQTANGFTKVRKTFPVSCDLTNDDCVKGRYMDLVPDSKRRSIIYFEDGGTALVEVNGKNYQWRSNLLMVCWLNQSMFVGGEACSISPALVVDLLNAIPTGEFSQDGFTRIKTKFTSERPKNSAIFSRYTYDEGISGYLLYPYDFFALNFQTTFITTAGCFDPIQIQDAGCNTD